MNMVVDNVKDVGLVACLLEVDVGVERMLVVERIM